MAKDQTKRLSPKQLQADTNAFAALSGISDYNPSKAQCKIENAQTVAAAMKTAQDEEVKAYGLADAKRDIAAAKEWEFHNLMLAVKDQVIAQYGDDSDELQKLGLKKKSEYKAPKPKRKASTT